MTPLRYGEALAWFRVSVGKSKRALAHEIGVDPSFITHLEANRKQPSLATLEAIAWACSTTPWRVVRRAQDVSHAGRW